MKIQQGFTLIELMITVAIIGILAGIAYPSYQDHVFKSRRADAKAALSGLANAMERYYTENNDYAEARDTNGVPLSTVFSPTSPVDGGTAAYNLRINAAGTSTYTLHAIPTGPQANDRCGTLTLAHTGAKGISSAHTGVVVTDCW
ncbi:type IV pilin protein [Methylicorpusculum sp.]|uniref:type IV pilin protein n=1 Tax=Methylicorpusculum sp. TaxID=2713644 RepID=UPI002730F283|nr:type IV pilin protein [Methylicorpusculum sp.]MDP2179731.1 type IV pilin protein [Methylicorpusculum sp.]MDP3529851.1 type IV pilin protein [Methylicorpusculum sp.]MDZ4154035.1 type IV pilin protein [Methylicorpusculum sp.]